MTGPTLALAMAGIALLAGGVCGCGGVTSGSPRSDGHSTSGEAGYVIGDADDDDRRLDREPEDGDDHEVRDYGHPGSAADARAIASVLERYYAAAAADDGAAACALLSPGLAGSLRLEGFVPKEYRPAPGSDVLRGKDCVQVESLLFEIDRQQLLTESTTLLVTDVRVTGPTALVVMRFKGFGERDTVLQQEGGAWKVDTLIDQALL